LGAPFKENEGAKGPKSLRQVFKPRFFEFAIREYEMPVQEMYNDFRERFPEITKLADEEHILDWDEIRPEYAFTWFESLAKTLNREMAREEPVSTYLPVFEYFRSKFLTGDDEEKKCIEVSFVENLFWQIKSEKAEPYWQALPSVLKELYVKFHGCVPA